MPPPPRPWPSDPALDALLARPPSPLGPGRPDKTLSARLRALDVGRAVLAGLLLRADDLHASHEISQELHTPEGSFWHAVMHRREPDAHNSKYWWRKVGAHPVLDALRTEAPALGYSYTNPQDFVDFCERVRGQGGEQERLAERVQDLEWRLLMDHCRTLTAGD